MMQAVVCHAPGDYRVEELPIPEPGPDELLIKVGACGICGSDVKCYEGATRFWGTGNGDGYCEAPVIPGHEFSGTVVAGATERFGCALGEHVVAEQILPCGRCRFCGRGQYWMCEPNDIFGFKRHRAEGGMAEYAILPKHALVHRIDPSVSTLAGAYIEPLACAVHAVERAEIERDDVVVVAGIGSIGLCMLQVAKTYQPGLLIAVGTRPLRLDMAARLGADVVVNARETDPVTEVRKLSEGYGADVCIEASGSPDGPQQALDMVRKLGTLVAFSTTDRPVRVNWTLLGDEKELTIKGSHLGPNCYPRAIQYVADGVVDVESLVTDRFGLSQFQHAIDLARSGEALKVALDPALDQPSDVE